MKNKLLICIIALSLFLKAYTQTVQWPVYPTNSQGNISGTVGEYRSSPTGFHLGLDITSSSIGNTDIYAINAGVATVVQKTDYPVNSYIQIGNLRYIHVDPAGAVKAAYDSHQTINVNIGDRIGTMHTQNPLHLHLQDYNVNYLAQHLSPFIDNATPVFPTNEEIATDPYKHQVITNDLQFYRNGLLRTTPEANLPNLALNQQVPIGGVNYTNLYNKVDIAVHVIEPRTSSDGTSGGHQCAPNRISWVLRNAQNLDLINDVSFDFTTMPINDANHINTCFHPQSAGNSNPTIYIITSSPSAENNYDRYFNSGLRVNTTETWPDPVNTNSDAHCNADAQYPDGKYQIIIRASDVSFANNPQNTTPDADKTVNVLLDNFRPYIEKVEVRKCCSTGELVYEGHWTWNGTALSFSSQTPVTITAQDKVYVKVFASEAMQSIEVTAFGSTKSFTKRGGSYDKQWEYTYDASSSNVGAKNIIITSNSQDLAGNHLQGFTSRTSVSSFPVHQSDGTWNPSLAPQNDIVHTISATSSKANIGIWDNTKSIFIDYTKAIIAGTKFFLKTIPLNTPVPFQQQIATVAGDELWVITDPDGTKTTYTSGDFEYDFSKIGTYTISLSVQNGDGTDEDVKTITVTDATVADFTQTSDSQNTLAINFTDASSHSENINSWYWYFGDGSTSTGRNPSHTYSQAGDYSVTMQITDQDGEVKEITKTIHVENKPKLAVDFVLGNNPESFTVQPNTLVQFMSNVQNITGTCTYLWDFGDGTSDITCQSPNPTHIYGTVNDYTVKLTVTDGSGTISQSPPHIVTVSQLGSLDASFTFTVGASDNKATFTITSNQYVTAYLLFGDGSTSPIYGVAPSVSQTVTHTYSYTNTYKAQLWVAYNGQWVPGQSKDVVLNGAPVTPNVMIEFTDSYPVDRPWVDAYTIDVQKRLPDGYGTVSSNSPNVGERGHTYYYRCLWMAYYKPGAGPEEVELSNFFLQDGQPYTYLNINDPAVQSCFNNNQPFKFQVRLELLDGSTPVKSYAVEREVILYPPISLTGLSASYSACQNASLAIIPKVTGGAPPYIYTWNSASGSTETKNPTKAITVGSNTETYTLMIGDARSGMSACYKYGLKTFTVQPSAVTVEAGTPVAICGLNSTRVLRPTITGGAGSYSFSWSPSNNLNSTTIANPSLSSPETGSRVYTLTATDRYGCSASDQVTVNFYESVRIEMPTDIIIGCGQTKTISPNVYGGSGNYSYSWSNGATTKNVTVNETAPLSLTFTATDNVSGCSAQASVNILTVCNTITTSNYTVGKQARTITIPVNSSPGIIAYTAHTDCTWFSITSGNNGYSGGNIVINILENTTANNRNGKIIVESPGLINSPYEININQTNDFGIIRVPTDYAKIQDAINSAANGDKVEVDEGHYYENITISGAKTLSIKATGCPENTIISPSDFTVSTVTFSNNSSILQGFTIDGNNHYVYDGSNPSNHSGAVANGGGIYIFGGNAGLYDLVISNNSAYLGGGIWSEAKNITLKNVKIINNSAAGNGGILIYGNGGQITLQNVLIANNKAVCKASNNIYEGVAGGIGIYGNDMNNILFDNVTICSNPYEASSNSNIFNMQGGLSIIGGPQMTIKNSIIKDDIGTNQWLFLSPTVIVISYSDIYKNIKGTDAKVYLKDGVITSDPMLDAAYNLMSGSPCINAAEISKLNKDGSRNDMGYTGGKGIYNYSVQVCNKGNNFNPIPQNIQIAGSCSLSYLSGESEDFKATRKIALENGFAAKAGSVLSFKIQPRVPSYNEPFQYDDKCIALRSATAPLDSLEKHNEPFINDLNNSDLDFMIYPNPTSGMVKLELLRKNEMASTIEISDVLGVVLKKFTTNSSLYDLDISRFAVGSYFIRVINGNNSKTKLVQKL